MGQANDNLPLILFRARLMKKNGFTLIELLVTVTIIIILASALLPSLSRGRELARRVVCMNNLRQIGMGMVMYSEYYDAFFPYRGTYDREQLSDASGVFGEALGLLYDNYIGNPRSFYCPSEPEYTYGEKFVPGSRSDGNYDNLAWDQEGGQWLRNKSNYRGEKAVGADLYITYGRDMMDIFYPGRYGKVHRGGGHNVLYIGGHVRWFNIQDTEVPGNFGPDFSKIDE